MTLILFSPTSYSPLTSPQQTFQESRQSQAARNMAPNPHRMRSTAIFKGRAETNHFSEALKNQKCSGDSFMRVHSVKPAHANLLYFSGTSPDCDNPVCEDDHCNGSDCYGKYDDNYGDYGAAEDFNQKGYPEGGGDSGYDDWEQDKWSKWNKQSLAVNKGGFSRWQIENRDNFLGTLDELEEAPVVGKFAKQLKNHEIAKGGPPFDEDFDEWLEGYNAPKG